MRILKNSLFTLGLFAPAAAAAQEMQGRVADVPGSERDFVVFVVVLMMLVVLGVILVLILKDPRKLFRTGR